jgi:hypothetical protein
MRVGFAASVTIPFSCVRRSHHELHLLPDWTCVMVWSGRSGNCLPRLRREHDNLNTPNG